MCLQLVSLLKAKDDGRGLIRFVNIDSIQYDPQQNEAITYEEAMETIHAIKRDGTIVTGPDALKLLYSTVGWGGFAEIASWPIISQIVEAIYQVMSKLRLPMGKSMDAVLALRRMKMTDEGIEHCVDDEEECQAEW
jgi:predicted DCC family thiol-disulfide oxidoreductase YuxK